MIESLEAAFRQDVELVEQHLNEVLAELPDFAGQGYGRLKESVAYSLTSGGKRFRPVLALLTAEALQIEKQKALPWGCVLEMVHTYSLIHDDLPLMDNDDYRRGKPTNHKVYGEAMALLAGDGLLTEAFFWLAKSYRSQPDLLAELVGLLAGNSGLRGMVAGQAMDIEPEPQLEPASVEQLHRLKTGALIEAAVLGVSHIAQSPPPVHEALKVYSRSLGLAFQVADDLLDYDAENPEPVSLVGLLGVREARAFLEKLVDESLRSLKKVPGPTESLQQLALYNLTRLK